jgi:putative acetyltransferase
MLSIQRSTSENPDFHQLVKHLDKELWDRYDTVQALYDKHNKIEKIDTVVIAYFENTAIGCGCIKYHDPSIAEIKRMYVLPSHRGRELHNVL